VRINSATASQSFLGMIHPASSRTIGRALIAVFAACLFLCHDRQVATL
jgi:hypothetical protein